MKIRAKYDGASFMAGAIVAAVLAGYAPMWALAVAALFIVKIGPSITWKNDGHGWRICEA